jgi:hypothetical protein
MASGIATQGNRSDRRHAYLGQTPHIERHFTGTATVRDIVIGMVACMIARAISWCECPPHRHAFRMIPTFVARMSQMERDACAIVCLVYALQRVWHAAGRERSTCRTRGRS